MTIFGWIEGDRVTVARPIKVYCGAWFLPGEQIYILEIRGQRVRARCPATGADGWIELAVLIEWKQS
jgi:hypothetical protein